MSDIATHFCGQTQPHPAHAWQTSQIYGAATLIQHFQIQHFQCGGYSPAPWIVDSEDAGA